MNWNLRLTKLTYFIRSSIFPTRLIVGSVFKLDKCIVVTTQTCYTRFFIFDIFLKFGSELNFHYLTVVSLIAQVLHLITSS